MEQFSGSDHHPLPFFPRDLLLQESILPLLPVSTLAICQAVCRAWRSTIQSPLFLSSLRCRHRRHPDDLYFVLFTDFKIAAAYHPSRDRWVSLSLHPSFFFPYASAGSLLVARAKTFRFSIYDLFSGSILAVIPEMEELPTPWALALIDEPASRHYKIVAISAGYGIRSRMFDSRSGRWELQGQFPSRIALLGNAVFLDGLLFVLSRSPDQLLTFDPINGRWDHVDVAMPPVVCSRILDFEGGLFLVGGLKEAECIAMVGIWELDRSNKEWRLICSMPDDLFRVFAGEGHFRFLAAARMGIISFYNVEVLMFDLHARRWWWAPPCHVIPGAKQWFGHAIEPRIDLLK